MGRGSAAPSAPSTARSCGSAVPVERADLGQPHAVLGERAGLVRADDVDPGQALDRRQLLHQALALPEPDHADREGDAGEQDEALGHHRHERGDHAADRVVERRCLGGPELAQMISAAGRDHQVGDDPQDPG